MNSLITSHNTKNFQVATADICVHQGVYLANEGVSQVK